MHGQTEYELERQRNIERNKKLLVSLGLDQSTIIGAVSPQIEKKNVLKKRKSLDLERLQQKLNGEVLIRRSSRLEGKEPVTYTEPSAIPIELRDDLRSVHQVKNYKRDHAYIREKYTPEHIAKLGTCKVPWPHVNFEKTYDPVRGTTCHQCRQKTIDKKTRCSKCDSLRGMLCGTCLQNRYGENIDEVFQLDFWECPCCRGICNCSICRTREGKAPTGVLAPTAIVDGFPSVAHYLIHTYQKKEGEESEDEVEDVKESDDQDKSGQEDAPDEMEDGEGQPIKNEEEAEEEEEEDKVEEGNAGQVKEESEESEESDKDEKKSPIKVEESSKQQKQSPSRKELSNNKIKRESKEKTPKKKQKLDNNQANIFAFFGKKKSADQEEGHTLDSKSLLKVGQLVACRAPEGDDYFWLAKVLQQVAVGNRKPVEVQWFEKKSTRYYFLSAGVDSIPRGSIFYANPPLTEVGSNLWRLEEDLQKYDK